MHPRLLDKPYLFVPYASSYHYGTVARTATDRYECTINNKKTAVSSDAYTDLCRLTYAHLNDRLTHGYLSPYIGKGKTLRSSFDQDYRLFRECENQGDLQVRQQGVYAWYPAEERLVRYAPAWWHWVAAIASNGSLYRDQNRSLTWYETQHRLSSMRVGVAGCSVGSSVIHAVMADMRVRSIKIADGSRYKIDNINRIRLTFQELVDRAQRDVCAYKARIVARQIYAIDPFADVYVYDEGITHENILNFFAGDEVEPPLDLVVDEVDSPAVKVLLREEARRRRIPLVMVTDVGSAVQVDVRRFDNGPTLPLTHETPDAVLYAALKTAQNSAGDRDAFFCFVDALIGTRYRSEELGEIVSSQVERPTETLFAQLGSTVMVAGGIAAETIARIRLGYEVPERTWFSKK